MRALLALILGASSVLGTSAASQAATGTVIYVSPQQSDALARAQQLVRSAGKNTHGDITVELASGTYRLTQPLTFAAQDSGTNGHDVVWTAAPGAHPVLSGAKRITGWHLSDPAKGIWSAPVPAACPAWPTARRARSPCGPSTGRVSAPRRCPAPR